MRKILVLFFLTFIESAYSQELVEEVNDPNIKTVLLYALNSRFDENRILSVPIINLNSNSELILEFDDLSDDNRLFKAKIVSCDVNWEISKLRDLDFLSNYNEFFIDNYQHSQSTKVPYMHYDFKVPKPKVAGNFILQVYSGDFDSKVLISKRFYVLDAKLGINAKVINAQDPLLYKTHQQLDFSISYRNLQLRNPKDELIIKIRQNYRDDKIKSGLKPSSINSAMNTMNFQFFNNENTFSGSNEFRFFNISTTYSRGQFVEKVVSDRYKDLIYLKPQKDRSYRAYIETFDQDGRFLIKGIDQIDERVGADYVNVVFVFEPTNSAIDSEIYFLGQLTDWKLDESNRMIYDSERKVYLGEAFLKQGIYNYLFVTKDPISNKINEVSLEGEFSDTQNAYEIFVYFKSPADRNEKLIGYNLIKNSRIN